jgi:hypothetical protein
MEMPEMAAAEAAERLGWLGDHLLAEDCMNLPDCCNAVKQAAAILCRGASGELAPVIPAQCIDRGNDCFCSNCNSPNVAHGQRYCEDCGAILNGKDDNHEIH